MKFLKFAISLASTVHMSFPAIALIRTQIDFSWWLQGQTHKLDSNWPWHICWPQPLRTARLVWLSTVGLISVHMLLTARLVFCSLRPSKYQQPIQCPECYSLPSVSDHCPVIFDLLSWARSPSSAHSSTSFSKFDYKHTDWSALIPESVILTKLGPRGAM